jgi:hypothetical protein
MTGAVRRAVEHYQNHLDCAPSRPGASFVRCTVVDADGTPSTRKVATAIAGTGHPRSAKDSNYAREHSWPAARVHDPALPAAGSTASLLGAAAGVAAAGIEATHPRGRARQALRGLQLAGQPAALDALGAGPAQVQASALAQAGRTLRGLSDSLQPGSPLAQAARTIEARTQGRAQQLAAGAHRTVPDRDGVAR